MRPHARAVHAHPGSAGPLARPPLPPHTLSDSQNIPPGHLHAFLPGLEGLGAQGLWAVVVPPAPHPVRGQDRHARSWQGLGGGAPALQRAGFSILFSERSEDQLRGRTLGCGQTWSRAFRVGGGLGTSGRSSRGSCSCLIQFFREGRRADPGVAVRALHLGVSRPQGPR